VPFAGWEISVWYSSVGEEHTAVRQAGGQFDVANVCAYEVSWTQATAFLKLVGSNYTHSLEVGQSCGGYLADPDGQLIDDFKIYRAIQQTCK
jgi:glycine hydroxymethyltransferase